MAERDQIFRTRLVAVMTALNGGESRDPAVRRLVGSYAYKMAKETGAKNWADLKARADGSTYDQMLAIFREQGGKLNAAGDAKEHALSRLSPSSLIARHQKQGDLVPGVGFLDRFIDECATLVKLPATVVVTTPPPSTHEALTVMADEHAAFIERYHQVVDELDRTGRSDPETMWLLGSLVARLVTNTSAQNWTQLKLILDNRSLKELVETLDGNASTYEAEGKTKAAYVARLLGISLVASKIMEPKTRQRDQLLSHFIDTAAYVYITNHNANAAKG